MAITLVHGTWGRKAPFLRKNSALQAYLCRQFEMPVEFLIFPWSGANTHAARLRAGHHLAQSLRGAFKNYPEHAHALICHSHGGNVAMYALRELGHASRWKSRLHAEQAFERWWAQQRQPGFRRAPEDAICFEDEIPRLRVGAGTSSGKQNDSARICCITIGTPFLSCSEQATQDAERIAERFTRFLEAFDKPTKNTGRILLTYLGPCALGFAASVYFDDLRLLYLVSLPLLGLMYLSLATATAVARRAFKHAREMQVYSLKVPLLCMRMQGDEARLHLGFLGNFVSASGRVLDVLRKSLTAAALTLLAAGILVFIVGYFRHFVLNDEGALAISSAVISATGGALWFLNLLLTMFRGAFANLVSANFLGFGWDGWESGWFLSYRVADVPAGASIQFRSFTKREIPGCVPSGTVFLRHSLLYSCKVSLDVIATFLSEQSGLKRRLSADVME